MDQATNLRKIVQGESAKVHRLKRGGNGGSPATTDGPKVIAITSGKGGVGKTNVVGNLAIACQRAGKKVLIFDGDLGLANIDIIYGLNPKYNIDDVITISDRESFVLARRLSREEGLFVGGSCG